MIHPYLFAGLHPSRQYKLIQKRIYQTTLTKEHVINQICGYYNIDINILASTERKHQITRPRHVLMYFLRKKTDLTFKRIGEILNRHYSSVIMGAQTVEDLLTYHNEYSIDVDNINGIL